MCIRDRIQEVPFDQIHSGMRVEAVWVDDDDLAISFENIKCCLLYTSDAADERSSVDLGGRRIIKKQNPSEHVRSRTVSDKH